MSPAAKGGVVAALVVVAGVMGWWCLPGRAPQVPVPRSATPSFPWLVATAGGPASPLPPSASAPASAVHGPGEVQVCGGAWLTLDADKSVDYAELSRALGADSAGDRLLAALHADPGVRAQGVALYLDYVKGWRLAGAARASCDGDDCASRPRVEPAVNPADALARYAATTSDPAVYSWAWRACGFPNRRDGGPCSTLSLEQWAHLDPDNATPWTHVLAAARERGDRTATEEALYRIANAKRDESGQGAMSQVVLAHLGETPADLSANWITMVGMAGIQSSWAFPGYGSVADMCRGDALRDANRRQVCDGVAQTLAERSDSTLPLAIGAAIGDRAGWPNDRVDRLRGERDLYDRAEAAHVPEVDLGASGGSCNDMRRELDWFRRVARRGEAGLIRDWVASSGRSADEFIDAGRRIRVARAEAAASASARRAASAPGGSSVDASR